MPIRLIFRCQFCDARPCPETAEDLRRQLQLLLSGIYLDAEPGMWLTWHGHGAYGPNRYACADHRQSMKDYLKWHYGTLGWHPAAEGPHPAGWYYRDDSATIRRRRERASKPGGYLH